MNARVVGLAIALLGLALAGALWWAGLRGAEDLPHDPAPPWARVGLGGAWAAAQIASLWRVHRRGPWRGVMAAGVAGVIGIAVMAFGRAGLGGLFAWTTAAHLAAVTGIALQAVWWVGFRVASESRLSMAWALFDWLAITGCVYLFSASPAESGAQLMALLATGTVRGLAAVAWPWLLRAAAVVARASPARLSIVAWVGAIALLVVNGVLVRTLGLTTPQVAIGPVAVAPYFLAAALVPVALALNVADSVTRGWRALAPAASSLPAVALLYVRPVEELGTLAVVVQSLLIVLIVAGTGPQAALGTAFLALSLVGLRVPWVAVVVAGVAPRAAERLDVLAGRLVAPDQLARVVEAIASAGTLGHTGGARMQFLVGPEVGKDYMFALVSVSGGWTGLASILVAFVGLLVELCRVARGTLSVSARAIHVGVFAVVLGNLLVTMLWSGGVLPFVGVPVPILARAGSHLLVFAVLIVAADLAATGCASWARAN